MHDTHDDEAASSWRTQQMYDDKSLDTPIQVSDKPPSGRQEESEKPLFSQGVVLGSAFAQD